jgi:hypothetical protein
MNCPHTENSSDKLSFMGIFTVNSEDEVVIGVGAVAHVGVGGHTAYLDNLSYTVSENFDHWILFNGRGESGLLCVEPQCGKVDGLNIKDGCKILNPNEETGFWIELKTMK